VIHLLLTDFGIRREGDIAMRWPLDQPITKLRGSSVRVVYDDRRALMPVLRDLCAHDVGPIELLDIDAPDWLTLHYDPARLRAALRDLGLPVPEPRTLSLGRESALWLISQLTTSELAAA
jgi:hypothetical protein